MHGKRQHICTRVPKMAALFLLVPLIFIQAFFYYDTFFNASSPDQPGITKSTIEKSVQGSLKFSTGKSGCKQSTIRLNKRFQPESAPYIEIGFNEIPAAIPLPNSFGTYADPYFKSPRFCEYTLRGPPVVA